MYFNVFIYLSASKKNQLVLSICIKATQGLSSHARS